MAWISKLRDVKPAVAAAAAPVGWYELDGEVGFAYGGTLFLHNGTERPAGIGDAEVRRIYQPQGKIGPWLRACRLITDQKRPELDATVATAFAAPLFHLIGAGGACMSCCGPTASGKSTALEVAASVWGHPHKVLDIYVASERGLIGKLGALRNLPLYWDAPLVPTSRDMMYDAAVVMLSQGNTGTKWTRGQKMQEVHEFQTIVTIATTTSFWDYVAEDKAALCRTFEVDFVAPKPGDPGQLRLSEAAMILDDLKSNYGIMGRSYAKYLARRKARLRTQAFAAMQWFEDTCKATRPERLWLSLAAAIQTGATCANELGCDFDLERLRAFLAQHIETLRVRLLGMSATDSADAIEGHLKAFLEHFLARSVWTDNMVPMSHRGDHRLSKRNIKILKAPEKARAIHEAHVHYVINERTIIFRRDTFFTFLATRKARNESLIMSGMQRTLGATVFNNKTLLKGTVFSHARQDTLVTIDVPQGSSFERLLFLPQGGKAAEGGSAVPADAPKESAPADK